MIAHGFATRWVHLVHLAFIFALIIAAGILLPRLDIPAMDDHERAEGILRDLQAAEHALSQDILRHHNGLLVNYDSIDQIGRQITQQLRVIRGFDHSPDGPGHADAATGSVAGYTQAVARYAAAIALRAPRLERFRSHTAILRTSVAYYTSNLAPLIRRLGDGSANHDLLMAVQASVNDLAQLYLAGAAPAGAAARRADLTLAIAGAPSELRADLSDLASHISVIFTEKVAVDQLVEELLRGNEALILSLAADANVAILTGFRGDARLRAMILVVLSAILVGHVGFFIFRMIVARRNLRRANAQLEARVEERTAGLRAEVAEREKTASELHESEARLARVLEIAPDAMLLVDGDFRVRLYNLGAEATFGYAADEAIGCAIEMLIPDWHATVYADLVDSLTNAGGPAQKISDGRVVGRRKDGAVFPASVSVSKIIHNGQTVLFVLARDISERIQAEQDVIASKEQAEIANRAKSQFLANMSHELRTPLNAVIGFAEVIEAETFGPVGNPRYIEYIADIRASGQHLLSLINDILDLSKIEAGHAELYEEPMRVESIVGATLLVLKERAHLAGVTLRTELPGDLPLLYGDERKLKQILINLLTNAVKFTEAGGRIVVSATADPTAGFSIAVADTGIGIAAADIPRALASFQQVENQLNRTYQGTGLGLPLTVALVELHGGTLDIVSAPGVGTTVTARFPPQRIVAARPGRAIAPARHSLTGPPP